MNWRILVVLGGLLLFGMPAVGAEPLPRPGYFVGLTGGMIAPEGGREGYTRGLQLGYRSGYQSAATPRTHVSVELDIGDTVRRVRPDQRRDGQAHKLLVGLHLTGNNYFTDRLFLRTRIGGVYSQRDPDDDSREHRGRISFGLGLGHALGRRAEAIVDTGVQYGFGTQLYYTATGGIRFHF